MNDFLSTEIISGAYAAGYKKCLEDTGVLPKFLTQNQAHKKYRRRRVEFWVRKRLITQQCDSEHKNGVILYNRERLELLDSLSYIDIVYGKIPPEKIIQP